MRAVVLLGLVAACGGGPAKPPAFDPFAYDPVAAMAALEDRLTSARQVDLTCEVRTEGLIALALAGDVHVERQLVATIALRGDGVVTDAWSSKAPFDDDARDTQSTTWADGLMIGLTRMGITHNFANVMGGADPETGNGDIRTWVTYRDVDWKTGDPDDHTLTFTLSVLGGSEAEAELTLDDRGLPRRRTQTVHFAEGDMHVVEDCSRFDVVD